MHLTGFWRVLVLGPLSYIAIAAAIRVAGKRVLSNMNPFDLLVDVSIGSAIAIIVLDPTVTIVQAALALVVPLALQFGVAWVTSHSERLEKAVKQHPALLLLDGQLNHDMLHHEMITEEEVREAARKAGMATLQQAKAVVLEVDGTISVIRHADAPYPVESSTLEGVKRSPGHSPRTA